MGELLLLLTDDKLVVLAEFDLSPSFVDALVEWVNIFVDVDLSKQLEEVEQFHFRANAPAAVFPVTAVALIRIGPGVLAVVASDQLEFLKKGVVVVLI